MLYFLIIKKYNLYVRNEKKLTKLLKSYMHKIDK